jgi:hypothetical protein
LHDKTRKRDGNTCKCVLKETKRCMDEEDKEEENKSEMIIKFPRH